MNKPAAYFKSRDFEFAWLSRALIIGLLAWAGTTLLRVDAGVQFNSHRIEHLETYHDE